MQYNEVRSVMIKARHKMLEGNIKAAKNELANITDLRTRLTVENSEIVCRFYANRKGENTPSSPAMLDLSDKVVLTDTNWRTIKILKNRFPYGKG